MYESKLQTRRFQYYEYILICFYDVFNVSYKPSVVLYFLHTLYRLKEPLADPDHDLGTSLRNYKVDHGNVSWYPSDQDYFNNAAYIVDKKLGASVRVPFPRKTNTIL